MNFLELPGVYPQGSHSAWEGQGGMTAEIRQGNKVVKRLRGETAWSDAVREAGDLNSKER